jgi:hypothetical protein
LFADLLMPLTQANMMPTTVATDRTPGHSQNNPGQDSNTIAFVLFLAGCSALYAQLPTYQ